MPKSYPLNGQKLTAELMYPLIELWLSCDRTQQSICQEYDIKPHTFNYWRHKYRREKEELSQEQETSSFLPIEVNQQGDRQGVYFAQIQYKDGTVLRFYQPIDLHSLKTLLPL